MSDEKKLKVGDAMPTLSLQSVAGKPVRVPDPDTSYVHLQFRRFAGCPICNLHLESFVKRKDAIAKNGIHEVLFFHSSRQALLPYYHDVPFDVIADPNKDFYNRFGVGTSIRAVLSISAMGAAMRGARLAKPALAQENGPLGLPADVLINREGRIVAVKYGNHANDHWSVDEVLRSTP